jgi:hypothetical protein
MDPSFLVRSHVVFSSPDHLTPFQSNFPLLTTSTSTFLNLITDGSNPLAPSLGISPPSLSLVFDPEPVKELMDIIPWSHS